MEKNISKDEIDFIVVLKKSLRAEGMSTEFKQVCEKALDIISKKREQAKDI